MSGKPQFDDDAVINSAMDVFWRHGYAASSIDQLATAIHNLQTAGKPADLVDDVAIYHEAAEWLLRYPEELQAAYGRYYTLGRIFVQLIGRPLALNGLAPRFEILARHLG